MGDAITKTKLKLSSQAIKDVPASWQFKWIIWRQLLTNSSFFTKIECPKDWLNMKICRCNSVWIRQLKHPDTRACYQTRREWATGSETFRWINPCTQQNTTGCSAQLAVGGAEESASSRAWVAFTIPVKMLFSSPSCSTRPSPLRKWEKAEMFYVFCLPPLTPAHSPTHGALCCSSRHRCEGHTKMSQTSSSYQAFLRFTSAHSGNKVRVVFNGPTSNKSHSNYWVALLVSP